MLKSILSKNCCKEIPFPKLMIGKDTGNIALFEKNNKATYVYTSQKSGFQIAESVDHFLIGYWSDYVGDVCLTNEGVRRD